MTLVEKLDSIAKTSTVKSLKKYPEVEKAKDFDELWQKVIKPNLPDKDAVIGWHNLLMQYVQQDNAVFTLRCYPDRRGGLNKVFVQSKESFGTFYTDNSVPFYLYSMAKDGFVPNLAEFKDAMINNCTFPCSYFPSKGAYPQGKNHRINTKGYKLAHIFSTGENYDKNAGYTSITNFCEVEFPNANITKWNSVLPNGKYYRRIDIDDPKKVETVRTFAVAHFLRSVHPLNYFLVPMTTGIEYQKIKKTNIYWYDYDKDEPGKDIGEYPPLIEYVAAKIKELYKDTSIYEEFLHLIFPIGNCINPKGDNVRIDAEYAIDIWKRNIGSAPTHVTGSIIPSMAKKSIAGTKSLKTKNDNKSIVLKMLKDACAHGLIDAHMLSNLTEHNYTLKTFAISTYPLLVKKADLATSGFPTGKFYSLDTITINGDEYCICSQWTPKAIDKLKNWHANL